MYRQVIESGDLHADLWEDLNILTRHIAGPEDVTVGEHPALGLCIVSHYGFEDRFEWWTLRPIRVPARPAPAPVRCEIDEMLDELDRVPA